MYPSKNFIRLLALAGLVILLIVVGSTLSARTDYEWPHFTMTYQVKGNSDIVVTKRLIWFSKNHWIEEIVKDQVFSRDGAPRLNYTGAKYEFRNGEYIVYDPISETESRTQMEPGVIMSPAEWIVPGYEQYLGRGNAYRLKQSANGSRTYHSQEQRHCQTSMGEPPLPNCNPSQIFSTDITFEEHGIPIQHAEFIDDMQISKWEVIDLKFEK